MLVIEAEIRISELQMLIDVHCNCEICKNFREYINKRLTDLKLYVADTSTI